MLVSKSCPCVRSHIIARGMSIIMSACTVILSITYLGVIRLLHGVVYLDSSLLEQFWQKSVSFIKSVCIDPVSIQEYTVLGVLVLMGWGLGNFRLGSTAKIDIMLNPPVLYG